MSEPTQDPLREALRSWDPATRIDEERSRAALDEVRREIRRGASWHTDRRRVGRRVLAAAAVLVIVVATVALLKDLVPGTEAPGRADAVRAAAMEAPRGRPDLAGLATPQHLILVASNGVRIDWTIPPQSPAEAGRDRSDSEGSNR